MIILNLFKYLSIKVLKLVKYIIDKILAHKAWTGVAAITGLAVLYFTVNSNYINVDAGSDLNKLAFSKVDMVEIPIKISNFWGSATDTNTKANFAIKFSSPSAEPVYNGVARIVVPDNVYQFSNYFEVRSYATIRTVVLIPKTQEILKYLNERRFEFELEIENRYFDPKFKKTGLVFDNETIKTGFTFVISPD